MIATSTRPSRRLAIARMCRECIYDSSPGNGTWREQTEARTAPKCPLYPVRPLGTRAEDERAANRVKSIENSTTAEVPRGTA
jgi:hypothetical protein